MGSDRFPSIHVHGVFSPTAVMRPFFSKCLMVERATEPLPCSLSLATEGVISLGSLLHHLVIGDLAKHHRAHKLHLDFALAPSFFFDRPPAMATFSFSSMDFWTPLLVPMASIVDGDCH